MPADPVNARHFAVEEEFRVTGGDNPKPFLIFDNGEDQPHRTIVYGSAIALRLLAEGKTWFMDGNFSLAPKAFSQVYVIRAKSGGVGVTCVYAFLTGKTRVQYEEMLVGIRDKCAELGFSIVPKTVVVDFEQAAIQAVQNVFGP
jgi:hypothetical protein